MLLITGGPATFNLTGLKPNLCEREVIDLASPSLKATNTLLPPVMI